MEDDYKTKDSKTLEEIRKMRKDVRDIKFLLILLAFCNIFIPILWLFMQ